jgi:hypothetical protein
MGVPSPPGPLMQPRPVNSTWSSAAIRMRERGSASARAATGVTRAGTCSLTSDEVSDDLRRLASRSGPRLEGLGPTSSSPPG